MIRSLGLLIAGSVAFWLVTAYPAFRWGGETAVVYSGVAGLLCLVPTAATLVWASSALRQSAPEQQLLAVMGGMGVRLVVVLGGAMALFYSAPYFDRASFWAWVVVCYLVTLTLEMAILLGRHAASPGVRNP